MCPQGLSVNWPTFSCGIERSREKAQSSIIIIVSLLASVIFCCLVIALLMYRRDRNENRVAMQEAEERRLQMLGLAEDAVRVSKESESHESEVESDVDSGEVESPVEIPQGKESDVDFAQVEEEEEEDYQPVGKESNVDIAEEEAEDYQPVETEEEPHLQPQGGGVVAGWDEIQEMSLPINL
jgi:hypothetical protein